MTFIAILVGLALIDGTAMATFFVPLWLLLAPGPFKVRQMGVYLGSVIGFYFLAGLVLLAGADVVVDAVRDGFAQGGALDTFAVNALILALGALLLVVSFRKPKPVQGPSRMARWRERTLAVHSPRAIAMLAISVCALEFWTMLPYLGAVAMISALDQGLGIKIAWLAIYCVMMVWGALILVGLRLGMGERLNPALDWINAQMNRHGGNAVLWIVGIVGALMMWFAASRLLGW